ncbi:MAG: exodeoxyribonuclease VII large subunit [Bacteroidales bacterium]
MTETIRLSDLQQNIKQTLNRHLSSSVWIVAEISEIKSNYSGHCYLTLVEQDERSKKLLAQARATIWAARYKMILSHFQSVTGRALKSGIQVLVCVDVNFHEVYGMSLNILDIDPTYTMGDIAKQRQETINKLSEEGVFDMNKEFALPSVIQNIAVVSSETAAGFQDFINQLMHNARGFRFNTKLYPALVQGNTAAASLINALENIKADEVDYDAVVIIRGGGAQTDLACFDDYNLSRAVAIYPCPIVVGIGHDKDVSVVDMVANKALKTPTAVAEFIVSRANDFDLAISTAFQNISTKCRLYVKAQQKELASLGLNASMIVNKSLNDKRMCLDRISSSMTNASLSLINKNKNAMESKCLRVGHGLILQLRTKEGDLNGIQNRFEQQIRFTIKDEISKMANVGTRIESLNPINVMKQGYCYAKINDKTVCSIGAVKKGDRMRVTFIDGEVESIVDK